MQRLQRREWEQPRDFRRDFYTYSAEVAALAVGGNASDTIPIEADSDFILQKLAFHADLAGVALTDSTRVIPNVGIIIKDTGSGRQLMDASVPIPVIFGTGELPFILPNPRLFMRNSTIQVSFTSFEAASTPDIFLGFIGYKIYETI